MEVIFPNSPYAVVLSVPASCFHMKKIRIQYLYNLIQNNKNIYLSFNILVEVLSVYCWLGQIVFDLESFISNLYRQSFFSRRKQILAFILTFVFWKKLIYRILNRVDMSDKRFWVYNKSDIFLFSCSAYQRLDTIWTRWTVSDIFCIRSRTFLSSLK